MNERHYCLTVLLFILFSVFPAAPIGATEKVKIRGRVHNLYLLDQMLPAEIRFYELNSADLGAKPRLVGKANTTSDGRYEIALPVGLYLVEVDSVGFTLTRNLFRVNLLSDTADLSLAFSFDPFLREANLRRVRGQVQDADGRGIPDVTVTLNPMHASTIGLCGPDQTRTDKEGSFELQSYYEGYYVLSAMSPTKGVAARVLRLTGTARQELEEPLVLVPLEP